MTIHFEAGLDSIELIYILLGGMAAMCVGIFLAKRQARRFASMTPPTGDQAALGQAQLPGVNFFDYGDMRFLHLGTPCVQGSMKISKPFEIHLEYLQRMMAWLLFTPLDQVHLSHAMQLGLGSGALTKFCHTQLHMRTTAIELNPQVISTCRTWFHLPQDNDQLHVVLADAAEAVKRDAWLGKIDVLQIDLYDQDAKAPVVDHAAFYADCQQLLTQRGCMVVNVFGRHSNVESSIEKISHAFKPGCVWSFKSTTAGNTIVLAFQTPPSVNANDLFLQAQAIEKRWSLPATKWLKVLAPI